MIILGIVITINNVLDEAILALDEFGVDLGMNFVGDAVGGASSWIIAAALMIIFGIVAIYGYKQLEGKPKGELLLWGIIYIIVGILGAGLGGLLVILGGIVLVIDYFL
jgi:hypothetical protein